MQPRFHYEIGNQEIAFDPRALNNNVSLTIYREQVIY